MTPRRNRSHKFWAAITPTIAIPSSPTRADSAPHGLYAVSAITFAAAGSPSFQRKSTTMIQSFVRMLVVLLSAWALAVPSFAQTGAAKAAVSEISPVGDWRGDSICQVRPSACHDEDSLYHVTKIAGKPGQF